MIRTLTGFGFALALVGAAHAQGQQLVIHTAGLSAQDARAQLYKAAQNVCSTPNELNTWDSACVEETYADALHQLHAQPRVQMTASNGGPLVGR